MDAVGNYALLGNGNKADDNDKENIMRIKATLLLLLAMLIVPLSGCEMSCRSDSDAGDEIEDAVEDVGDAIEDATD